MISRSNCSRPRLTYTRLRRQLAAEDGLARPRLSSRLPGPKLHPPRRQSAPPRPITTKLRPMWNAIASSAAQKIVSAQQFDAAESAAAQAAAKLEAARRQAAAAGSQVSASGAAVRSADAHLAAAQAAVENTKLQLSYAYITAPVSGTVARRNAEVGALVQVGQTLMSIVPDENVWVTANLKETQLTHVRVGDRATFTVDAYPGRKFDGRVKKLIQPRGPDLPCCLRTMRRETSPRWCSGSRSELRWTSPQVPRCP